MARYTGPKHRIARREGVNVLDKTSASLSRRLNIPPGVHGKKRKRALSEFGQQLREKQKAKAMYGLLEKQFSNLVKSVQERKGNTAEGILARLETRLDNIVYRLGFASSRFMSRQLVSHRHVLVNGNILNIPSYRVKTGDVVSLKPGMEGNPNIKKILDDKKEVLSFLEKKGLSGKLLRMPGLADLEVPFDMQLIIEYYSR